MGTVRKFTGVDKQVEATNRNAAAQEAALKASTDAQVQQAQDAARAAADAQSQQAARMAAEDKASTAAAAPLETAEVQLDAPTAESATASKATRRARYGRGYSGGVQI